MLNSILGGIINTGVEGNTFQFLALERAGMGIIFRDKREDCHRNMRF